MEHKSGDFPSHFDKLTLFPSSIPHSVIQNSETYQTLLDRLKVINHLELVITQFSLVKAFVYIFWRTKIGNDTNVPC